MPEIEPMPDWKMRALDLGLDRALELSPCAVRNAYQTAQHYVVDLASEQLDVGPGRGQRKADD